MLVLTRKYQEKIRIGDNITITVLRMKGKAVRLGIEAPTECRSFEVNSRSTANPMSLRKPKQLLFRWRLSARRTTTRIWSPTAARLAVSVKGARLGRRSRESAVLMRRNLEKSRRP